MLGIVLSSQSLQDGGVIPAKSTAQGMRVSCTKHGPSSPGIPSSRLSAFFLSLVCSALALTCVLFVFRINVSVRTDVVYKLLEYHISTFLWPLPLSDQPAPGSTLDIAHLTTHHPLLDPPSTYSFHTGHNQS